ncbi:hypothetical protein [Candidatus Thiodictyon syntrophicum]|jgi:hypothetical protein|uniref:hypothetical protein n=1 Tax=Candidatus Thiodictyon syntrophicum TaxID=1166950 RepID=UPI0012FD56F0|nr:hypothetical protein [Candidatus Thiodictyon syntrophicum]
MYFGVRENPGRYGNLDYDDDDNDYDNDNNDRHVATGDDAMAQPSGDARAAIP